MNRYEVWSRAENGRVRKHGEAVGLTFEDACKHLACESIDFWTYYEKGRYRGRPLSESAADAESGVEAGIRPKRDVVRSSRTDRATER